MRNVRKLLAGTALVGSLAAGLAITAPAAQASTADAAAATSVTQAQSSRHFFGPYYSHFGGREDRGDRSYFRGYWTKSSGRYYFYGRLFDRDHDRQYSYVWFRWHDDEGFHGKFYRTRGEFDVNRFGGFRKSDGFDDFDIRVCEGGSGSSDCGGWHDVF